MAEDARILVEERLAAALLLSFTGGFTDVYSYLFRGQVFANAVTGNMVLMGLHLASGLWTGSLKYLLAIAAYGCGVFAADAAHARLGRMRLVSWHQAVLALEIVLLAAAAFVPPGRADSFVNATISFVCAMQVQTFRKVRGHAYASTMCIGNMRSGTDALCAYFHTHDKKILQKSMTYFAVIGVFAVGAGFGSVLTKQFGERGIWVSCILLTVSFLMMFVREDVEKA